MAIPIEYGNAYNVLIGPVISTATNQPTTLAHNAAGMDVDVFIGTTLVSNPTLINSTGNWYWRSHSSNGMHLLTIPAASLDSGVIGQPVAVRGNATGVYPFGTYHSYVVTDPAVAADLKTFIDTLGPVAEALANILTLSDDEVGIKADVSVTADLTTMSSNLAPVSADLASIIEASTPANGLRADVVNSEVLTVASALASVATKLASIVAASNDAVGLKAEVANINPILAAMFDYVPDINYVNGTIAWTRSSDATQVMAGTIDVDEEGRIIGIEKT